MMEEENRSDRSDQMAEKFDRITQLLRVPLEGNPIPLSKRWKGGCLYRELLPDLVPVNPDNHDGFCDRQDDILRIHVKNQGEGPADQSITRITFESVGPQVGDIEPANICTPRIEPGGIITLCVPTPDQEQGWNGEFKIEINAGEPPIPESDTENNIAKGACSIIGPIL